MANTLYDNGRQIFLSGGLNWGDNAITISAILVDTAAGMYIFAPTHTSMSDVPPAAIVAGPENLVWTGAGAPNRPVAGGAADADDVTFDGPSGSGVTGPSIEAIILYRNTGVAGTSSLLAYIDTATGLPITPNGGNIIVTWDNGVNKIFRL